VSKSLQAVAVVVTVATLSAAVAGRPLRARVQAAAMR
jgi:hypothetical protein